MTIDDVFLKIMDYYKIDKMQDLASIFNVSQPAISQWKSRNSIKSLQNKCKELGIYDEIFGDIDEKQIITITQGKKSKAAGRDLNENKAEIDCDLDEFTVALIKKLIKKFGDEDTLQKELMGLF